MLDRCHCQTGVGLWNRPVYKELWPTMTSVVRLGDRSDPNCPTHIPLDVDIPVRFIKEVGRREDNIQPVLYPDEGLTVRLTRRIVKPIKELAMEDLAGGAPDTVTPELVKIHLGLINNSELPSDETVVTVYHFEHRPPVVVE